MQYSDRGVTLVELLISMSLTLVIGSILTTSVIGTQRLYRATEDESVGQTDVRTTIERLGRDIRNARSLDSGATQSQLVLWVDSNSDYKKQTSEVVTWKLVASSDGHFDVTRLRDGVSTRTAKLVISQIAFCYQIAADPTCIPTPITQAQADAVRVVSSDMEYDANVGRGTTSRHAVFSERLRNVT